MRWKNGLQSKRSCDVMLSTALHHWAGRLKTQVGVVASQLYMYVCCYCVCVHMMYIVGADVVVEEIQGEGITAREECCSRTSLGSTAGGWLLECMGDVY